MGVVFVYKDFSQNLSLVKKKLRCIVRVGVGSKSFSTLGPVASAHFIFHAIVRVREKRFTFSKAGYLR